MADAVTEISLDALHDAIVAAVAAAFPSLQTVEFYRPDRKAMRLPGCLLEIEEFDGAPDLDPGTGQLAMMARFQARFVLGFKTPGVQLEARKLATAFAAWLHKLSRWPDPARPGKKLPTGPAEIIGAYPDSFSPELDEYEVWRVEWQQAIHLGESEWKYDGVVPTTVFVGIAPETGLPNIDKYRQLIP